VTQAGSWGRYLGKLDLTVDPVGDSVLSASGKLIETLPGVYPPDTAVVNTVARFENRVATELDEIVATLAVDWKAGLFAENNIGNWECDAIREYTGGDVVLVNSGSIRRDVPKGPIRQRDFWELNPFNNALVSFTVTGTELRAMLDFQASGKGELMQVSGLRYKADHAAKDGERLIEAEVGGKTIDPAHTYTVVTNNYVAGHLDALLGLTRSADIKDLMAGDRDVLLETARKQRTIMSQVEGRITLLNPPHGK
jgi:5'-nucleotidase